MEEDKQKWQGVPVTQEDIEEQFIEKPPPQGIGGWLIVFIVWLCFNMGAILAMLVIARNHEVEPAFFSSDIFMIWAIVVLLLYLATLMLLLNKNILFRKVYIAAVVAGLIFSLAGGVPYLDLFWLIYLHRSQRVRNTFS